MKDSEMTHEYGRFQEDINETSPRFQTRSGEWLSMRLIRPEDADLLVDLFKRLTPESRRRRFHQSAENISEKMMGERARELADVDNLTLGGAVLAIAEDPDGAPQAVGVSRLGRVPGQPHDPTADAAIVIRDDYQGEGVGTELLRRLVLLARQMHVQQMSAFIEADNQQALRLFLELDLPTKTDTSQGETTMLIDMPE